MEILEFEFMLWKIDSTNVGRFKPRGKFSSTANIFNASLNFWPDTVNVVRRKPLRILVELEKQGAL